jgi:hypothetical protein
MRRLILFAVICSGIFACNAPADKATTTGSNAEANLALADKYRHAVEAKDVATMDSLLADNYMGYGPSVGDSVTKTQAIENWKSEVATLYESIEYTRSETLPITVPSGPIAGDWVSNWALLTIKYKDGRGPVSVWVNAAYKIENGKIVRSRTFYNEADVLRQLGYQILPPGAGK